MESVLRQLLTVDARTTRLLQTSGGEARMEIGTRSLLAGEGLVLARDAQLGPHASRALAYAIGPRAVEIGGLLIGTVVRQGPGVRSDITLQELERARDALATHGTMEADYFDDLCASIGMVEERVEVLAALCIEEMDVGTPLPALVRERAKSLAIDHIYAGMRNEALLTFIDRARAIEDLRERVRRTPFDATLLSTQPAIQELLSAELGRCMENLVAEVPSFRDLPYVQVKAWADLMLIDAITVGACLGRAVLGVERQAEPALLDHDNGRTLLMQVQEDGELALGAHRAVHVLGYRDAVVQIALVMGDAQEHEGSDDEERDELALATVRCVHLGAMLEAALVRAVAEQREAEEVMERCGSQALAAAAAGQVVIPNDALPWPEDGVCRCGADLQPFLFCCEKGSSIPLDEVNALHGGETLDRQCCGANLYGFRCDVCGTLHTWLKGRVPRTGRAWA